MKGDTIEVDLYWNYMLRGALVKRYFKVLDKNHLLLFQQIWVSPDEADEPDSCHILYDFIPAHNLPPSSSFRNKLRRYLWENKKDWKAYKRRMKEMRKENRQ